MANNNIVTVTITVEEPAVGKRVITIEVDKEPVHVGGFDGIEWQISQNSAGWTFTKDKYGRSDGITIKNHLGKYKDNKGKAGNKDHQWEKLDKQAIPDPAEIYRYTIRVTNETTVDATQENLMTLVWDPTMHNP